MKTQTSLRILLVVVGLIAVAFALWMLLLVNQTQEFHQAQFTDIRNNPPVAIWLPPTASNISGWSKTHPMMLACRFSATEADFLGWAHEKGWDVERFDVPTGRIFNNAFTPL